MRVLLGVTGGIAAYKVAVVLRRLKEDGHDVRVVPTPASLNFVGRATWEALSGHPAPADTFDSVHRVEHVRLGQEADAVLVAPATADFLASYAAGEARDLLGNALLATHAPVVVAPAMHTEMWEHPATRANIARLRERGVLVIEPGVGRLTGSDEGPGRLPEPADLVAAFYAAIEGNDIPESRGWGSDLRGLRVVVTAGGTHEPIDAVRYIGNRSTGHQGFAIAEAARERGAEVTVVAANVLLPLGEGVARLDVETAAELAEAVTRAASVADVIVMAAAVADFTPQTPAGHKIKKDGSGVLALSLVETTDILSSLVESRAEGQIIVGFAAETGDAAKSPRELGAEKAVRKGADLLVVNEVGREGSGFGEGPNAVTILDSMGSEVATTAGSKTAIAHELWDVIRGRLLSQ